MDQPLEETLSDIERKVCPRVAGTDPMTFGVYSAMKRIKKAMGNV
jgi:hypothetical protein